MVRRLTAPAPSPARVLDALRGGHAHYPADREAAAAVEARLPGTSAVLDATVRFTLRAGRQAAAQGITRLVHAGAAGLLPGRNLHDAAREAAPGARVVYVNRDAEMHAFAAALLGAVPGCACEHGDSLRLLELPAVAAMAGEGEPMAVAVPVVLSFATDGEAAGMLASLAAGLPAGSVVAVSVLIPRDADAAAALAPARWALRSAATVGGWLGGMDAVSPVAALRGTRWWRGGTVVGAVARVR